MHARRSVVVVDDQEDIRECISGALVSEGYHVESFSSGRRALEFLANHGAGLILLDLFLTPEMSGAQLVQLLQARPGLRDIPLIAMSGTRADQQVLQDLNAREFLEKPFDLGALLSTVDRFCRPSRSEAAA